MGMSERIREKRLEMGYTQEELAKKLGLQKSAIAKYENGRVENIKRSVISNMANILKCSPSYLMGWEEEQHSSTFPDQTTIDELTYSIDDVNMLEEELINELRELRKEDKEEHRKLCTIFSRIPRLPKKLREDIYEYVYLSIRKYDKEKEKSEISCNEDNLDDGSNYFFNLISTFRDSYSESDNAISNKKCTEVLNAAHERTDINVTDEMKKHDENIMDDENF